MSKEKQIEEMARAMCPFSKNTLCRECSDECFYKDYAERAYNAGYRKGEANSSNYEKVNEWISVEERLPTRDEADIGLIAVVNGIGENVDDSEIQFEDAFVLAQYDFYRKKWWSEIYGIEHCIVDYWMPIQLPPKMKGGE